MGYTPALLTSLAFVLRALQQDEGGNGRELLTAALLLAHFLKRDLEVLFVHSYSGTMEISATFICVVYALSAALICHQQAVWIITTAAYSATSAVAPWSLAALSSS